MDETNGKGTPGGIDTGPVAEKVLSEGAFHYYRGLVGQIEIALPHGSSHVLLLSSSLAGEGTTEVAVGLALTLAVGMARKTAIVDFNLGHPDLHKRFGSANSGLSEYLSGKLTIEQALMNTTVPNLYIMPLGGGRSFVTRSGKEPLVATIANLRSRFDYVLIDSPPIGAGPESTLLVDAVDAVVLVVKHGSTRREVIRKTKETIERAGGNILGIVLNKRKFPVPEFLYKRL